MGILSSISNMFTQLSGNTFLGKISIAAGALMTAYFTPIVGLLFACFACTLIDMLYGIKVAKKLGKKITSRKNWKGTLLKIRDEYAIIMLLHIVEHTLMQSAFTVLSGGATVIICLTEIWSIIENLNTLDPEGPWRALGKFLRKKGEDYVGIQIDLKDDGTIKNVDMVKES